MPNPVVSSSRIRFSVPRAGTARVAVFDAEGRRVTVLKDGPLLAGPQETSWDGRDAGGRRIAPGIYWMQVKGQGFAASRAVMVR